MSPSINKRFFGGKKRKSHDKTKVGLFMETYAVAPAPSRDYYALQLYQKKFVWTRWKISQKPYIDPIQKSVTLEQFKKDSSLQNELTYIFGADVTDLISDIANEVWSLTSLPSNIIQIILSYVSVYDILRLSQVCKRLLKECSSNELWKSICKKQWKILIYNDVEKASLIGWKNVYMEKMKPKKYKLEPGHSYKPNLQLRNRILSVSSLNSPDSRVSTPLSVSSFAPKKAFEPKKTSTSKSFSEIFGKDFKSPSIKTGTAANSIIKVKQPFAKNIDQKLASSGRLPSTPKLCFQKNTNSISLMIPSGNSHKTDTILKNQSAVIKSKITSIRARSATSQIIQPTENQMYKAKTESFKPVSRPSTGKRSTAQK